MFVFYSLFVYIFYTLLKRSPGDEDTGDDEDTGNEANSVQEQGPVSMETKTRLRSPKSSLSLKDEFWSQLVDHESPSDSDGTSGSDEDWLLTDTMSPLTEFLTFKQEVAGGAFSQTDKEYSHGKAPSASPLVSVMTHLLSFLEQYSHMQRLQDRASEYKSRLRREEARSRKKRKLLRSTCKQELRDKLSLIENLQEIIDEQQGLVQKLQQAASKDVADPGDPTYSQHPLCPASPPPDGDTACGSPPPSAGVQRLVHSIQTLQTERSKLLNEVESIKMEVEQGENEKRQLSASFETQIHCLREQVREHEEELIRLRTETGVTDSEKRIQHLSLENESLKENLRVTQGILQQLSTISRHPSEQLLRENEELQSKVCLLESSVQQKLEQLLRLDAELSELQWRRETEDRHHQETVQSLQLQLHQSQEPATHIQYVAQRVEGNSEVTQGLFRDWEHRNRELLEQVTLQEGQLHKLEQQLRDSEETRSQLQYKIVVYETEIEKLREDLMGRIEELERGKDEAVREASECSEEHLNQLRQQFTGVQQNLRSLKPVLKTMKANYNSLRSQVKNFAQFYEAAISEAKRQIQAEITVVTASNKNLMEKYEREVVLRKKYHDQLVELRGNIRVLCRVKPVTGSDWEEGSDPPVVWMDPSVDCRVRVMYKGRARSFELDKVFPFQATQEEVFEEIEPLITSCIDGYNVCIFAYGQTGSGKTYTMEGVAEAPGINQRALRVLFQETVARSDSWRYSVSISMLEIYNEQLRDLLSEGPGVQLEIRLKPDGSGQLHVPGLTQITVTRFEEISKFLTLGRRNRVARETNMNEQSSRSHVLLAVTVTGTNTRTNSSTTGRLNLVDLAGSERVWKSGAQGERLKEAQNINRSLLALGDVIHALRVKRNHIPFRNSKLTYLLQDSLRQGNKTVMVVQVSPLVRDVAESVCSLKFAQRVCKVQQGPAIQCLLGAGNETWS